MIEWMEYPIGLANLDEEISITWSDGTQDVVPGHDGDGETIYQLPNLMEEIFSVRFYHLWESREAKFADEYPGLYRYKNGVLVLRASSEERFQNAFICKERNPALCLLSWINGDVAQWTLEAEWEPEGCTDNHLASVSDFLALIGSGMLDDFPPIVLAEDEKEANSWFKEKVLVKVDTGWWYPEDPNGPDFGYPAGLFLPGTYEAMPTIDSVSNVAAVIGLNHRLDEEVWKRLVKGVTANSKVLQMIQESDSGIKDSVFELAKTLKPIWEKRWLKFW